MAGNSYIFLFKLDIFNVNFKQMEQMTCKDSRLRMINEVGKQLIVQINAN